MCDRCLLLWQWWMDFAAAFSDEPLSSYAFARRFTSECVGRRFLLRLLRVIQCAMFALSCSDPQVRPAHLLRARLFGPGAGHAAPCEDRYGLVPALALATSLAHVRVRAKSRLDSSLWDRVAVWPPVVPASPSPVTQWSESVLTLRTERPMQLRGTPAFSLEVLALLTTAVLGQPPSCMLLRSQIANCVCLCVLQYVRGDGSAVSATDEVYTPPGETAPLTFVATGPDTFTAAVRWKNTAQGRYRLTLPAAGMLVDAAGNSAVLTADHNASRCDPRDPRTHAPLTFEFQLLAPCVPDAGQGQDSLAGESSWFRRRLPRAYDGTLQSLTPRFLGEIVGTRCIALALVWHLLLRCFATLGWVLVV